ncbi:hypothetical protein [Mesorhizobium sp. M0698]|uniref:hypothetical protein n=1 Tax=Mesorhizobium sp. M0698 TaxID=2956987 RepID=UPI003335A5E8
MLLSIWSDLSDVKLAEALDDGGSFRRLRVFGFKSRHLSERLSCVFERPLWPIVWTRCSTRSPASSGPKRFR